MILVESSDGNLGVPPRWAGGGGGFYPAPVGLCESSHHLCYENDYIQTEGIHDTYPEQLLGQDTATWYCPPLGRHSGRFLQT